MRPDPVREAGLRELGAYARLTEVAFNAGVRRPLEERARLLEEYKVEVKAQYRRLARELHPDMTLGLPQEERDARENRLKALSAAYDYLMKISVREEPVQSFRVRPIQHPPRRVNVDKEIFQRRYKSALDELLREMDKERERLHEETLNRYGGIHIDWSRHSIFD